MVGTTGMVGEHQEPPKQRPNRRQQSRDDGRTTDGQNSNGRMVAEVTEKIQTAGWTGAGQRNGPRRTTTMETARPMAGHAEEQQWDRCPYGPDRHRGTDLATNILPKSRLTTAGMGKPRSNETVNDDRAIEKRGKRFR